MLKNYVSIKVLSHQTDIIIHSSIIYANATFKANFENSYWYFPPSKKILDVLHSSWLISEMLAMEMSGKVGLWYNVGTLSDFEVSISSAKLAPRSVGCPNEN